MSDSQPDLASRAHAFLFSEGGTISKKKLTSLLGCDQKSLNEAVGALAERLHGTGETVVETATEVTLAVAPATSEIVRAAFEKELGEEIGTAGLEVLAIILYRGDSTRAQIDYIRGVNTSSTLRNLLARGLVERIGNPEDAREYLYRPTVELLAHLGVERLEKLPDYNAITSELSAFETKKEAPEEAPPTESDSGTIET